MSQWHDGQLIQVNSASNSFLNLFFLWNRNFRSFQLLPSGKTSIHTSILMGNLGSFIVLLCFIVEINCGKCLRESTLMQFFEKKSLSSPKSLSTGQQDLSILYRSWTQPARTIYTSFERPCSSSSSLELPYMSQWHDGQLIQVNSASNSFLNLFFLWNRNFRSFQLLPSGKTSIHTSILMGNLGSFIVLLCFIVEINCGKCLRESTLMQFFEKKSLSSPKSLSTGQQDLSILYRSWTQPARTIYTSSVIKANSKIYLCTLGYETQYYMFAIVVILKTTGLNCWN